MLKNKEKGRGWGKQNGRVKTPSGFNSSLFSLIFIRVTKGDKSGISFNLFGKT